MTVLSLTVFKKANRQARLAIFCMQKCRTSETRTTTGAQHFLKYVQTDWQSSKI
jgi:hypothetical protein